MGIFKGCFRKRRMYRPFFLLAGLHIALLVIYVQTGRFRPTACDRSSAVQSAFILEQEPLMAAAGVPMKKILFWTVDNENGRDYIVGLGGDAFRQAGCPVWQCENHDAPMLNNGTGLAVEDYDAVVFFDPVWSAELFPANRSAHQHYVFWTLEAPGFIRKLKTWNRFENFFNLTMTYRRDSDIIFPYGWFTPVNPSVVPMHPSEEQMNHILNTETSILDFVLNKTRMAVWAASNCNATNGRNELVERLAAYINVDIYGACGRYNCTRAEDDSCRRMFGRIYKFYLALENSFCVDYVTEKFFMQMHYDMIPVVFDLHGNYEKIAPPHSYINAAKFPSVVHLANYLILLDTDDTLYSQYFWWRKHYVVHNSLSDSKRAMCELCTHLHKNDRPKVVDDVIDWWDTRSFCKAIRFPKPFHETSLSSVDNTWTVHDIYHASM